MEVANEEIDWCEADGGMSAKQAEPLKQLEQDHVRCKRLLAVRLLEV